MTDHTKPKQQLGHLLVVDDEENVAITVSEILRREGLEVEMALSGDEAIRRLQHDSFDLVLTDLHMEGTDGISVLTELRRKHPLTIAIVLTGFASLESAVASIRQGAYDYLVKPCIIDDLKLTIQRGLEHRRLLLSEQEAKRRLEGVNAELEQRVHQQTEQLIVANRELLRHNEAKDVFLATLSHELRTPLTPIIGWTRLLLANPDSSHWNKGLQAIERNALYQAKLIEDLLDVSRIITGKVEFQPELIELRQVVEAAIENIKPKATEKSLELILQTPTHAIWILGVRVRLDQILSNLLSNSIKFTDQGGAITVSVSETQTETQISIQDTGIGIPCEFLPHVFDRFKQAEGFATRKHEGLGLGLSIVRAFVELHRGRVWAESKGIGLGSTFNVAFPIAQTESVNAEDTILVLTDNVRRFDHVVETLQTSGVKVSFARNTSEAVEFLKANVPTATIVDAAGSETDALAHLAHTRDVMHAQIPIVAVAASAREPERQRLIELGFTDVVSIASSAYTLLDAIRRSKIPRTSTATRG